MEEVLVVEEPPQPTAAVSVIIENPKSAQTFLQCVNAVFPYNSASEHLKRIRRSPGAAAGLEMLVLTRSMWEEAALTACGSSTASFDEATESPEALARVCAPFTAAVTQAVRGASTPSSSAPLPELRYSRVEVPDRSPRRSPEVWAAWNAVWPLAVPRPHPPVPPPPALVDAANAMMLDEVLRRCVSCCPADNRDCPATPAAPHTCLDRARFGPCLLCHMVSVRIAVAVVQGDAATVVARADSSECPGMRDSTCPCGLAPYVALNPGAATVGPAVLDHPVTRALKKLAERQQRKAADDSDLIVPSLEGSDAILSQSQPVAEGTHLGVKRGRGGQARLQTMDPAATPYLANDLDVYVSHEPCVMCAMALVHSRVRRVFYAFPNPVHGGLGSVFAVHAIPSLNHHFQAFRCIRAADVFNEQWRPS